MLTVLVNLLLFNLDKLEEDIRALKATVKVLEAVVGFITNWANIHFQKESVIFVYNELILSELIDSIN